MFEDLVIGIKAWLFSNVATALIKAPELSFTSRTVGRPEAVDVPTRHGRIKCFIWRPAEGAPLAAGRKSPVHINIHGGAFLIGAPHQDDHLVKAIAGEVGAVVVNVDYSRAPKVHYPHAHEECFDVLRWVAASGAEQGWDSGRITISGTSAGGNLALGVLEQAREKGGPHVHTGVLFVPAVDVTPAPESYVSDIPKPFVGPGMARLLQSYFPDAARRTETLASPGLAGEELASLPPLLIFGAEHDSLRPHIERFVAKIKGLGNQVDYVCVPGADHDFEVNTEVAPKVLPDVVKKTTAHLIAALGKSPA
ncbi:MAG TPA: alpha/beta hydrolase [Devosia sp.]|jgi:acetyl esterase|uniref:alpha/beta hydrolase n=1 Tax=Devosia sp. TaxID=1871048 RepID=UPI002F955ADE